MYNALPTCDCMDNVATCWSRFAVELPWHEHTYATLYGIQSQTLSWQKLQPNDGRRVVHCAEAT